MTITGPKVKDFTGDAAHFPVEIVSAPVFEVLMGLFTYTSQRDGSLSEFAVGDDWAATLQAQASPDLVAHLDRLTGAAEIWVAMIAVALDLEERTTDALVAHLAGADPIALRLDLMVKGCMHCKDTVDDALQLAAARGDADAIATLQETPGCRLSERLQTLLALDPAETIDLIAAAIEGFARELSDAEDMGPTLARDAEHKRAMARRMTPPQLVEHATNGITFRMQPEVDSIVLIPSIVIRPWVAIGAAGRRRIFCYPVADQHLGADADTPPAHLVEVYKALGDERRLRLLRILTEGPTSLADITERVGIAKSTVHHHLSILRQAGLVLITMGADKEYSLRRDAIPEIADLLAGFLTTTNEE